MKDYTKRVIIGLSIAMLLLTLVESVSFEFAMITGIIIIIIEVLNVKDA